MLVALGAIDPGSNPGRPTTWLRAGEEVDDYVLELFAEWPEAWKRRWLYLEEW